MKKKIFSLLLHPLTISLIISIGVWYVLPNYFSKYKADLISEQALKDEKARVYFEDINNDGKPERIAAHVNSDGLACLEVRRLNYEVIDQWNFDTYYPRGIGNLNFFDINDNGFKEVYAITIYQDSIFMKIVEPFNNQNFKSRKKFIDTTVLYNDNYSINTITKFQRSKINKNEVYFNLNSGFSGYPRNLYKYNILTNKITKSPHLTNLFTVNKINFVNDRESIYQFVSSPQNKLDSIYTKRTDYSSWLTILNNDLQFVFEPIEFPNPYTLLLSFPYKFKNENVILTLANSSNDEKFSDKIEIHSYQGELLKQLYFPEGIYFLKKDKNSDKVILANRKDGRIRSYAENLIFENEFNLYPFEIFFQFDIDNNKLFDWVIKRPENGIAYKIYDNNFKHPVSININNDPNDYLYLDVVKNDKNINFFVQKNNTVYLYKYYKNKWFFLKYVSLLILYLFVFTLFWLVLKGYKIREAKKLSIEKEISELQLKTVNNQLNPHFVFNAINSISEMMLTDNKLEADNFICRFSDLMRQTLQQSDKISTTLQEELDYVENFIQLQQIRFQYQFDYTISIGKNVDTSVKVPKHVIYSYVENAIKHGLTTKKDGFIKISITQLNELQITIEDNGEGIHTSKTNFKNSTGNGIKIMEKMYELYTKLYKKKIHHIIENIISEENTINGVRVVVVIS